MKNKIFIIIALLMLSCLPLMALDQAYAIYAVNATDNTLVWKEDFDVGEKVWSTPTIAAGQGFVATTLRTMESSNPRDDVSVEGQPTGNLDARNVQDGSEVWSIDNIGKTRGSVYVDRQHVSLTTIDNQVVQVGGGDFSQGNVNNVITWAWREL